MINYLIYNTFTGEYYCIDEHRWVDSAQKENCLASDYETVRKEYRVVEKSSSHRLQLLRIKTLEKHKEMIKESLDETRTIQPSDAEYGC